MNRSSHKFLSVKHFVLGALVALAAVVPALAQRYWIDELSPAAGYSRSIGFSIDEAGAVFGESFPAANWYGQLTRWEKGKPPEDLGKLPGWIAAYPYAASDDGTRAVGEAFVTAWDDSVPFVWELGVGLAELPAPNNRRTMPFEINAAGTIVGQGQDNAAPYNCVACRWVYQGGHQWTLSFLPPLAPWPMAGTGGINESGVIVGWSGDEYTGVASGWEPNGTPFSLANLGGSGASSAASINDAGQYAGTSSTPEGPYRAFFYDGTQCINLGILPGYEDYTSVAARVSNDGTVIGYCHKHDPHLSSGPGDTTARAFVWRHGVLTALNDALVGGAAGWDIKQALDINEDGEIAGIGWLTGKGWRACRLTPAYGDMNCDNAVNAFDIDPFVLALTDPTGYAAAFPDCDLLNADINGDGAVNAFDIDPFVVCVTLGGCP